MKRIQDLIFIGFGWQEPIEPKELPLVMGIDPKTIHSHILDLVESNVLTKGVEEGSYFLTKNGRNKYEKLLKEIYEYNIIPEKHGASKVSKLKTIIDSINQAETMLTLMKSIWNDENIDVIKLIQQDNALRPSSFVSRWIDEMVDKCTKVLMSEDKFFKDMTMLGTNSRNICNSGGDVERKLILADLKRRQSQVHEALEDFYCLINGRGLNPGHWIVAIVGWIYCLNLIKGTKAAMEQIEKHLVEVVNPSHRAWLIYIKADILSDDGRFEEANILYQHSLGIMEVRNMKISMAEVKNSYGVNLFRMGLIEKAEKQWIQSRNICITYDLPRMKSLADINLSDIWSKNGNFRRAHDNLRRAEKVLKEVGDYEGISDVNFNRALVYVREGKVQRAHECFKKAESYELVYEKKINERREGYNRCLEENGYLPVRNPI